MNRRPKPLLAMVALVVAILACTVLLQARSASQQQEEGAQSSNSVSPEQAKATILKARKLVDSFFEQAANAECKENVSQMMVGKNGKPFYREDSVFDYQLRKSDESGSLRLTENRETRKAAFRDPYKSLLITNGFANMLLVLHENYEASYVFEPVGEEQSDGRALLKVHFKPVPGASSPAAMQLSGRNYSLPLHGDVWIDEASGGVVKLVSAVDGSLDDLGLHDLRSEVRYAYVQFHNPEEAYWLPASAVIDVETPKQHWRNVHHFSEYRRFRVTVQVDMEGQKP